MKWVAVNFIWVRIVRRRGSQSVGAITHRLLRSGSSAFRPIHLRKEVISKGQSMWTMVFEIVWLAFAWIDSIRLGFQWPRSPLSSCVRHRHSTQHHHCPRCLNLHLNMAKCQRALRRFVSRPVDGNLFSEVQEVLRIWWWGNCSYAPETFTKCGLLQEAVIICGQDR